MTTPMPCHMRCSLTLYQCLLSLICCLIIEKSNAADNDPHQAPRNPSSAKECAICHYRWVDTFFLDGRGTDLVPLQTEPVVGTSGMCFSCHDGSILDSRWAFDKERGHRTGLPPRIKAEVPKNFPLDSKGQLQCVTCHTAHGVPTVPGEGMSTFLRVVHTNSSMCMLCHPTMAGNSAGSNHPLGQVTNAVPRELWEKHADTNTASHFITCETCHSAHGNAQESLLKQNVSDSSLCLTCHPDKNSVNPDGSRNYLHAINVLPNKAVIPQTLLTNGAKLGKNGALTCLTCHKIHQNSIEKHLLIAKNDSQSSFCFNCHSDKKGLLNNKHNLTQSHPKEKNLAGKSVIESGPCSACHMPHKNAQLAIANDPKNSLCMSCHGLNGFVTKTNLIGSGHPISIPLTASQLAATSAKPVTLPLFDSMRRHSPTGNVTCATCHDPHKAPEGSPDQAKLLRKNGLALCQECHPGELSVVATKHDLTQSAPLTDGQRFPPPSDPSTSRNIQGRTPTESGSCGVCHLIHSATSSSWARQMPQSATPAEKCFSCHKSGGLAEKKVPQPHSHPIDISLEQLGLETTLPLYADAAHPTHSSKMTCFTCHDPHRGNTNITATTSRLFSTNKNFLRLPVAPIPKLCADCHPKEALVLKTEHDLSVLAPDTLNRAGQRAADTGPCGVCHMAHNAPTKSKMWARDLSQPWLSTPLVDAMCRACHSPNAVASNKIPTFSHHPAVSIVNMPASEGYDRNFFPLFDPNSGQLVKSGGISCSSCHNVHQWSARNACQGPGINTEGDSNNSFLRHRSAELPCKICHGKDAIYRYQYYHKSTSRHPQDDSQLDDLFR